jgi:hypothetical protein
MNFMEEKELFYYQKAIGLLRLGMTIEVLQKELVYFIQSQNKAAIKGYEKAILEQQATPETINS